MGEFVDDRKGFFKPDGEDKIHKLFKAKGIVGVVDLPLLRIVDNVLLEKLKTALGENAGEYLPVLYQVLDTIVEALPDNLA
jgi:hypothetical protein